MVQVAAVVFGCTLLLGALNAAHATDYQEYLLFDFYSKLPPSEVKAHFSGVPVVKSHKAIGEGRYFFLVKDEQTPATWNLTLPADAYNERVFPVEFIYAIFSHFRDDVPPEEELTVLPNEDLHLLERTWTKDHLTHSEMESAFLAFAGDIMNYYSCYSSANPAPAHGFASSGRLPFKFFLFVTMTDYNTTALMLKNSRRFGGTGGVEVSTVNIFNI